MSKKNFKRIMEGLNDALKTTQCEHKNIQKPKGLKWYCPDCGSQFNFNPHEKKCHTL